MITYQNAIDLYNAVKMHSVNNIGLNDLAIICNGVLKTNYNPNEVSLKDLHEIYRLIDNYAINASYTQLSSLYLVLREHFVDPNLVITDQNGNEVTLRIVLPEMPEVEPIQEDVTQSVSIPTECESVAEESMLENKEIKAVFDNACIQGMAKASSKYKKSK